jgi:hypothetical protein
MLSDVSLQTLSQMLIWFIIIPGLFLYVCSTVFLYVFSAVFIYVFWNLYHQCTSRFPQLIVTRSFELWEQAPEPELAMLRECIYQMGRKRGLAWNNRAVRVLLRLRS